LHRLLRRSGYVKCLMVPPLQEGQSALMARVFRRLGILIASAVAIAASPSSAHPVTVRVVSCEAGSCLLVRGHRKVSQAVVRINDRDVEASGLHSWQVRLPVATVRDWSAPFARSLRVAVVNPTGAIERNDAVRLPVGLLGHSVELASLVIHAP